MPIVDFSQFHYYPALLSSVAEHMGFGELGEDDKARIVPILELSQRGNAPNLDGSITGIQAIVGQRPFILDLNKEPAPPPYVATNPRDPIEDQARVARERAAQASYNALLTGLLNSANGFSAWRELTARFPNAVPVLQFTDATTQARQILRQAALLSREDRSLAIRVTQESGAEICSVIAQLISIVESPDRLLIIVDCGQGRQHLSRRAEFASETMSQILADIDIVERPLVRAVCVSNSFTRPDHDGLRDYENLDWRLWREARENFPFMFGDYGAMHRLHRQNTFVPPDYRASVVFPLDELWMFYRHPNVNDEAGWIEGSNQISRDGRFHPTPNCWGVGLIRRAAAGDINGINSARFWNAAKVNIHIHRQIRHAPDSMRRYGEDNDDE